MNPIFFRCLKNFCLIAAVATAFLLLRFSPLDYEYFSLSFKQRVPVSAGNQISDQASHQQDPCFGRYIFMHDLPPIFNQQLVQKCASLRKQFNFCPYVKNGGFGTRFSFNDTSNETVLSEGSWYATHQFMLEMIFHTRMKEYECLTTNSSFASAIYVPFYPGLEITQHLLGGFSLSVKDGGALDFTAWLKRRPEWARMFGWDHFFVNGRITWDFRRPTYLGPKWGSKLMNPTYFHPTNDSEVLQWQEKLRREERVHLFVFAGATRRHSTSIRGELISQCKKASRNDTCKLISCTPNDNINCNRPDHIIKEFIKSDFCLQPPGDSNTRRSTFDAILAGCIPVFFNPGSAYTQYFWHFPKNYTSYSIFIPRQDIKNRNVRVEEVL